MSDIDHIDVELPGEQSEIQHFDVDLPDQTIKVDVKTPPDQVTVKPTGEDVAIKMFEIQGIGPPGPQGDKGDQGDTGDQGPPGQSIVGGSWKAKTSTTSGDPGPGCLSWNDTIQANSTQIQISDTTDPGLDVSRVFLDLLSPGLKFTIQDKDNADRYQTWQIISNTDNGTHYTLTVSLLESGGGNISNNQLIFLAASAAVTGDLSYLHHQNAASDTWVIYHNLGKYPAIQVIDSAGSIVIGEISHIDTNTSMVVFSVAFGGTATCN